VWSSALKKIRNTAEFFHFFQRCDEASATHLLWDIEAAAGPKAAKAAGIVLGWCGRGTVIADDNLRKSWMSFRRARPFRH
jgi:hypothetical protein